MSDGEEVCFESRQPSTLEIEPNLDPDSDEAETKPSNKLKKEKDKPAYTEQEELDLETAVLGSATTFLSSLSGAAREKDEDEEDSDEAPEEVSAKRAPVWVDEDDLKGVELGSDKRLAHLRRATDAASADILDGPAYAKRREQELERIQGSRPSWALGKKRRKPLDSDDEEEEDIAAELLQSAGGLLGRSTHLPSAGFAYKRMQDASFGHRSEKPLAAVSFHPTAPLILLVSEAQKIQLVKLGETTTLDRSIAFESFHVTSGVWAGEAVAVASRAHAHFFLYRLSSGQSQKLFIASKRDLDVHVVSGSGAGWLGSLHHNGPVLAAATPTGDPGTLYTVGVEGEVYVWDLSNRTCLHRFHDQGCLKGSAIALSRDSRLIAVGSTSGVVNVYERSAALASANPKPLMTMTQLVTPVDTLVFNPTTELLLFASSKLANAVRLMHVASGKVLENFPGRRPKLGSVASADFESSSAFLVLGTLEGRAPLFRLLHYPKPPLFGDEE